MILSYPGLIASVFLGIIIVTLSLVGIVVWYRRKRNQRSSYIRTNVGEDLEELVNSSDSEGENNIELVETTKKKETKAKM